MVKRMRVKNGECMHIKKFTHQNNGGCVVLKVTLPCHGNQNLLICTVTLVTLVVVFFFVCTNKYYHTQMIHYEPPLYSQTNPVPFNH